MEHAAKIDRGLMQRQLGYRCPQFELVAFAMTPVAVVAIGRHVDREGPIVAGRGSMQGTASVPLLTPTTCRLEGEQVEDLLHRDLGA